MRILVTGGAGFLGSHLCDELLKHGHEVLAVDNYYTGSKDNIKHLLDNPRFEILRHDVINPLFVEVDGIFNLASPASPIHYQKHPVQTIKTNLLGSTNMLGLAKRLDCRILQASTSEVYGDPEVSPQNETYWGNVNPIGTRSCYDEGKRGAESLFFDYRRQYNVDVAVIRIFNTYGPRMQFNDGRVVSNFIYQAIQNKDITIYGDGSQTRSFCYVSDLINGMMRMFFSNETGPVNIGNPNEYNMIELARKILDLTNSNSKLVFQSLPSDDPKKRKPDITLASQKLDWQPVVKLEDGLQLTIEDFLSRL